MVCREKAKDRVLREELWYLIWSGVEMHDKAAQLMYEACDVWRRCDRAAHVKG